MHMADALVVPAVAGTMYAASTAAAAYSIRKVRLENEPKKIPAMGVMGAFHIFLPALSPSRLTFYFCAFPKKRCTFAFLFSVLFIPPFFPVLHCSSTR